MTGTGVRVERRPAEEMPQALLSVPAQDLRTQVSEQLQALLLLQVQHVAEVETL